MTHTLRIDMGDTIFTDEALAGLIGQRPVVTRNFNHATHLGRATVVGAESRDDGLYLTLDLPPAAVEAIPDPDKHAFSIGYVPRDSRQTRGDGKHVVGDSRLHEVSDLGHKDPRFR